MTTSVYPFAHEYALKFYTLPLYVLLVYASEECVLKDIKRNLARTSAHN